MQGIDKNCWSYHGVHEASGTQGEEEDAGAKASAVCETDFTQGMRAELGGVDRAIWGDGGGVHTFK